MQKIKLFIESKMGKDILTIIIVILVGIISFFLGRLSIDSNKNSLKIEYNDQEASFIPKEIENTDFSSKISNNQEGAYFASKRGKKYYPNGCSSGKSIKQENRVYFSSRSDAENAGYTMSSSC